MKGFRNIEQNVSKTEDMAHYTGREAANNGGIKSALEHFIRTGEKLGTKHPSDHIIKAKDILNRLKHHERQVKQSTLSNADKQHYLDRINQLRNEIEPAYRQATLKKKEMSSK